MLMNSNKEVFYPFEKTWPQVVRRNARVRTSENHLSSRRALAKMIKIDFLRSQEINQRTIQGVFIQEKLLNLGKNSKFGGVLT